MLKNYSKEPRDENWQSIEAKLYEDAINMQLKSKFDKFAVIPPAKSWDYIESKLKEPVYHNKANYGLRFAAGIMLLIFAISFSSDKKEKAFTDIFQGLAISESMDFSMCQDPEFIELDIVKIKPVSKKPRRKSKKAVANKKQKRLLDFILAVDEDIAASIDSTLIAELIKPADILSDDDMYATTGRYNPNSREGTQYRKMYYLPEIIYNLKMPADSVDSIFNNTIKP